MSDVLLVWAESDPIAAIFPADDARVAYDWADRELRGRTVNCTLCCSYNDAIHAAQLIGKIIVKKENDGKESLHHKS